MYFDALAKKYHFSLTDPWETLPEDVRSIILYGTGGRSWSSTTTSPGKGVLYQPFEASATTWSAATRRPSPMPASGSWRS